MSKEARECPEKPTCGTRNTCKQSLKEKAAKTQNDKDITNKKFLISKFRARDRQGENICHT